MITRSLTKQGMLPGEVEEQLNAQTRLRDNAAKSKVLRLSYKSIAFLELQEFILQNSLYEICIFLRDEVLEGEKKERWWGSPASSCLHPCVPL